jgi:tetratricopeptide (TPR) repeat protein
MAEERKPRRTGRPRPDDRSPAGRPPQRPRRADGERAPVIDDDVTGKELDRSVRQELSTLDGPVAGTVARHLVMVARLLDTDPEAAHRHAQHAKSRAGRVALVREAAGEAAYTAGHYDVALKELQAARRISGRHDFLAVIADCHRAAGHPEKAIALLDDPAVPSLPSDVRAELAVVVAGALRDTGRVDDAVSLLRRAMPTRTPREQWVARVHYALGDLLAESGQTEDAVAAFAAAEAGDLDGDLDAGDRVVELLDGHEAP